ncbi:MAG: 4a-hydroxytetrahydrobiopterin dehydratase [Verrucomicrobia bacterium TMED175]|nr:MAG: 4a-hydroxytetrahydrobiopterin dehydratase [Verrucomicrobia bacterium TMED175]|tara:strand:+ start:375 stop:704 length:330 start_codon:yes stop_codon:yes gene_type:complete
MKLTENKCEACRADAPKVTDKEKKSFINEIDNWIIITIDGIEQLYKKFTFRNYIEAVKFSNKIADLAEAEGHHPKVVTEWGKVEVFWWSHEIKGLHKNDFICAAKTDKI